MRHTLVAILVCSAVLAGLAGRPAPAAAAGGSTVYLPNVTKMLGGPDGWQTPFIVQNVGSATTSVDLSFYAFSDGTQVKTRNVPALAPGTSFFHDPNSDPDLAPGGQYSVVIRSSASAVVAVVNEHQNVTDRDRQEALSYSGIGSGATRIAVPYLAKGVNGWLTTMIIQNLGTVTANVTIQLFSLDNLKKATLVRTIAPGRSQFIDPTVEADLTAGVEYSAALASDQAIGAVVNAHNDAAGTVHPMGFSYNASATVGDVLTYVPYAAKNTDGVLRYSRLFIQNTGSTATAPQLVFRRFGVAAGQAVSAPAPLAPGQTWAFDLRSEAALADGEYSVRVTDAGGFAGRFAVTSATFSPSTAMGYTGMSGTAQRIFLPNVTRRLGGDAGWTTPIIVQAGATGTISLQWYRFSDGSLVASQDLPNVAAATSVRVDPRTVAALSDDAQYAVVITAGGGAAAIVTELSGSGGDGAMIYEGFPAVDAAAAATGCAPSTGPSGSLIICHFVGLPPNQPFTVSVTIGSQTARFDPTQPVGGDGTANYEFLSGGIGAGTATATAGGVSTTGTFTVTAPTFATAITTSRNGTVAATTKAGAGCVATYQAPGASDSSATLLPAKAADASGNVSWTYAPLTAPTGTWTHTVLCVSNREYHSARQPFTVP